jgi:Holliday junction resolvasome RuvABC endonuclease subunit
MLTFDVGLDISVRSPGFAIHHGGTFNAYFFPQRVRERGLKYTTGTGENADTTTLTITALEPLSTAFANTLVGDVSRYTEIRTSLLQLLRSAVAHVDEEYQIRVFIESYAFAARESSGSSFKLMEIGGVLKHAILTDAVLAPKVTTFEAVAISSWKKHVVGSGRANKRAVLDFIDAKYNSDLCAVFGFTGKTNADVATPLQDICDALCLALYGTKNIQPARKKKKSKTNPVCVIGVKRKPPPANEHGGDPTARALAKTPLFIL